MKEKNNEIKEILSIVRDCIEPITDKAILHRLIMDLNCRLIPYKIQYSGTNHEQLKKDDPFHYDGIKKYIESNDFIEIKL